MDIGDICPGRSGVVLFNWNTLKSLHCVCSSVCALKLCHGSVHLCVARPVSGPVDGHEGVNVTPCGSLGQVRCGQ